MRNYIYRRTFFDECLRPGEDYFNKEKSPDVFKLLKAVTRRPEKSRKRLKTGNLGRMELTICKLRVKKLLKS